jgi:hypothetical protein
LFAFFATIFLPATLPAKNGHTGKLMAPVSTEMWFVVGTVAVVCFAAAVFAFVRSGKPDKVAAVLGGIVTALTVGALIYETR